MEVSTVRTLNLLALGAELHFGLRAAAAATPLSRYSVPGTYAVHLQS
jgi:hypothetical protein